jgi:siroheme synthase (precorrin-2 oxidase/ferrochelatase)
MSGVPASGVPVLAGRVVIVAGRGDVFSAVARLLAADNALVAMVTTDAAVPEVAAHFRADPADPDVWERMVPHVEQRLGPIDAVVTDNTGQAVADRLVGPDLHRRGHGAVVVVQPETDPDEVVGMLVVRMPGGRPPAGPAR